MRNLLTIILLSITFLGQTQIWIQRSDLGGLARHRGTGMAIGNKGYIGLGHFNGTGVNIVLNDWWQYDPGTNSWSQKADFIGNNGNGNYGVIALGLNHSGYITGGVSSNTETWKYVPTTNSWEQAQDLPHGIADQVGFGIDSMGYCVISGELWAINENTNQWEQKNPVPFSNTIWNSSFVIDGKGYLKNGYSLWEYKPSADAWASRAPFPGLATAGSVGFSQYGKGYIVTGYQGSLSGVVKENWEFDPAMNTWTQMPNFLGTSRRFSVGFSIGDRSFLGTGTNGTNFKDFWEFNSTLSVSELPELSNIEVFPNPSQNSMQIIHENVYFDFAIYNLNGQLLKSGKVFQTLELNKNDFGTGIFILQIQTEDNEFVQQKIEFI